MRERRLPTEAEDAGTPQDASSMSVAVTPPAGAETPPAMVTIEPLLGLAEFAGSSGMRVPFQAGLQRWMQLHGHDPHGHYRRDVWQQFVAQVMAYK